jgi:hypothetical protein
VVVGERKIFTAELILSSKVPRMMKNTIDISRLLPEKRKI